MDLLVVEAVEDLVSLEEVEDPEGPATARWLMPHDRNTRRMKMKTKKHFNMSTNLKKRQ